MTIIYLKGSMYFLARKCKYVRKSGYDRVKGS